MFSVVTVHLVCFFCSWFTLCRCFSWTMKVLCRKWRKRWEWRMPWPDCWVAWHDLLCIWCLTRQDSKFPTGRHQWKITVFKRQPAIHVPHSRRSERAVIPCDISLENESQSALMEHILYDRLLKSTLMNWGGHRLAHPYVDGPDWRGWGGGTGFCGWSLCVCDGSP